jgi:hypothetical protein
MRFVGIRLSAGRLPLRRSLRRLLGFGLSVMAFGLGFLGIVFGERRRGWQDRFADTDVLYDERRPEPAPWSVAKPPAALPAEIVEPTVEPAPPSLGDRHAAPSGPSDSL